MLRALAREQHALMELAETSTNENEAADSGNDCLEVSRLLERLESSAKSVFEDQITTFEIDLRSNRSKRSTNPENEA